MSARDRARNMRRIARDKARPEMGALDVAPTMVTPDVMRDPAHFAPANTAARVAAYVAALPDVDAHIPRADLPALPACALARDIAPAKGSNVTGARMTHMRLSPSARNARIERAWDAAANDAARDAVHATQAMERAHIMELAAYGAQDIDLGVLASDAFDAAHDAQREAHAALRVAEGKRPGGIGQPVARGGFATMRDYGQGLTARMTDDAKERVRTREPVERRGPNVSQRDVDERFDTILYTRWLEEHAD